MRYLHTVGTPSWLRPDPRRDPAVESLRGLACLLLVVYHVRGGDPESGLRLSSDQPWSWFVDSVSYLRMPLFSFLSGFVYAGRPLSGGFPGFVRVKARRLLVPLLVVGTVFGVVQVLTGTDDGLPPWYLWHIVPVAHFWFLESIFWVAVVVGLLDRFGLLRRVGTVAALVVVGILLESVVSVPGNAFGLQTAFFLLPFYVTGVAARRFDVRAAPRPAKVALLVVSAALLVRSQLGLLGEMSRVPSQGSVVAGTLGVALCLCFALPRWNVHPLVVIGGFSFTIYTCHVFGTSATRMVLDGLGVDSVTVQMLVGTAAGLVTGIVVELLARRSAWGRALVLGGRWPTRATRVDVRSSSATTSAEPTTRRG